METNESQSATVPQVREYLTEFLCKDSVGAVMDDRRNDRLLVAIGCLEDIHEGLTAAGREQGG